MRPRDVPTAVGILMSMISFGLRAAEPQPLMFHVPGSDRNQVSILPPHESLTKMPAHFLRFMLSALHWRKPFL